MLGMLASRQEPQGQVARPSTVRLLVVRLSRGHYEMVLTAHGHDERSAPVTLAFTILR
jgi:hypothetical protein